jgi:hypothetical protein
MPLGHLIEYDDASQEVRAVYDDIMATRKTDWVNNFWKALAQNGRSPGFCEWRTSGGAMAGFPTARAIQHRRYRC